MINRVFFARIGGPDVAFNAADHAREDLEIFSAQVSHARQEAALISIECAYPDGGLIGGARWGILSCEVDGVVREVARGEISGFPLAMAGQTVRVDLICRKTDHTQAVDALFASRDAEVPVQLEAAGVARRTEAYLLDEVYHDRVTLNPSLEPISGGAAPKMTLLGEGVFGTQSQILDLSIEITGAPARSVSIAAEAAFTQILWGTVDLADTFVVDVPFSERATYTPNAFRDAVSGISLDAGYEMLSAEVETSPATALRVYTKAESVDSSTCVITDAEITTFRKHSIDNLQLSAAVSAQQPRIESIEIRVEPADLEPFGGEIDVNEQAFLSDVDRLASYLTAIPYPGGTAFQKGIANSIFRTAGEFRESCAPIVEALARRAARIAVESAHCITMTVQCAAHHLLDIDLRDRVEIIDVRLPGGVATGKVVGLDLDFGSPAATGQLVLSIPATGRRGRDAAAALEPIIFDFVEPVAIANPPVIAAVLSRDASYLVERLELVDPAPLQELEMSGSTPTYVYENANEKMPRTGILLELADLAPAETDTFAAPKFKLLPIKVTLPDGISLS